MHNIYLNKILSDDIPETTDILITVGRNHSKLMNRNPMACMMDDARLPFDQSQRSLRHCITTRNCINPVKKFSSSSPAKVATAVFLATFCRVKQYRDYNRRNATRTDWLRIELRRAKHRGRKMERPRLIFTLKVERRSFCVLAQKHTECSVKCQSFRVRWQGLFSTKETVQTCVR